MNHLITLFVSSDLLANAIGHLPSDHKDLRLDSLFRFLCQLVYFSIMTQGHWVGITVL